MGRSEDPQLKIIIAGSRGLEVDDDRLYTWVDWMARSYLERHDWELRDIEIVSGGARGVDACGERFSRGVLKREPRVFLADWSKYGKGAGPIRNGKMACYADAALIFMGQEPTPGSSNMAAWMLLLEKPVKVLTCR